VSYEDRIARMREQGVLTQEQAERLSRSLGYTPQAKEPGSPKQRRLWLAVALVSVLAALFFMLSIIPPSPEIAASAAQIQDVRTSLNQPEEIGQMSNSLTSGLSVALFIIIPLLLLLVWFVSLHNGLVSKEERVFESWAQVESNYQRRSELIPNMIETVSKFMRFEQQTLTAVVDERSEAMAPGAFSEEDAATFRSTVEEISKRQEASTEMLKDIKGAPQSESGLENLYAAQQALGASMHRILALAENYPVLRSADQMQTLQAELEGSENRINIARMRFNEAAAAFNAAIRRMPASLVASMGGFKRKAYFEADAGADKHVKVKFE